MKMKGFWKKFIARVLTAVMIVSIFSTVDMGWNVREVQAADEYSFTITPKLGHSDTYYTFYNDPNDKRVELKVPMGGRGSEGVKIFNNSGNYHSLKINTTNDEYVITRVILSKALMYDYESYYLAGYDYRRYWNPEPTGSDEKEKKTTEDYGQVEKTTQYYDTLTFNFNSSSVEIKRSAEGWMAYANIQVYYKIAHDYSDNKWTTDGTYHWRQCKNTNCPDKNGSIKDKAQHSGGKATCTSDKLCSTCGAKTQNKLEHTYDQYSSSGNTITVKCKRFGSDGCAQKATYTLVPNDCEGKIEYVNRKDYTGAVVTTSSIPSGAPGIPKVMYKGTKRDGSAYGSTETKPNDTGTYEAYITVGTNTVSSSFSIAPGGDIYKFNGGDGGTGSMPDQTVLKDGFVAGTKLNKNLFQRIGYAFLKWISDISGLEFEDEAELSVPDLTNPKIHTLTAQWKPNNYTLTFNNSGADIDNGTETATATYDAELPTITKPEKNCSEFKGYFTEQNGGGTKVYDENGSALLSKWTTPNDTTLYAHWDINHNWGYEAKDNQVIATCEDCGFSQKMTLNAPDSVYNKSAYDKASVTNEDEFPQKKDTSHIEYEGTTASGTAYVKRSTAPKDAGTYTATVTVTDDNGQDYVAEKSFAIAKAEQSATASVTGYTWGDTLPTPIISGEEESAAPTFYYNTANSNEGGTPWSELTSESLDAGTYYVYAEYTETANYKAGKTVPTDFTITGKPFSTTRIHATPYNDTYDKTPHTIGFSIDEDPSEPGEELTITFSTTENGTYTPTKPTFTNVGNYTVYYRVKKFGYSLVSGSETVKIAKKEITITPDPDQSKSYGQPNPVLKYSHSPALCTGDTFTGALTYEGASEGNAGTHTIQMGDLSAGSNYTLTLSSTPVNFTVNKATYTSGPSVGIGYTIKYVAETLEPASEDFELGKKVDGTISELEATPTTPESLTPGNTAQTEVYYVRYKANANQNESPWTAITIPARPQAPNAVGKQETVMNKKDAELTGVNSTMEYYFEVEEGTTPTWTDVSGNKIENPDNKNITIRVKASNANKNFYGIEKKIEFTASTTTLKVQIGDKTVEVPFNGTISKDDVPEAPDKPGKTFMYWEYNGKRWNFDDPNTPDDNGDATKVTEDIILTPVYGVSIYGVITAVNYEGITVVLRAGDGKEYAGEVTKIDTNKYRYSVTALEGYDYNLVVSGNRVIGDKKDSITKTMLVKLTQAMEKNVEMPESVFNSVVDRTSAGDYANVLVGRLDEMENTHAVADKKVEVKLEVSSTTSNHEEIKSEIKDSTVKLAFVELTLTKTVDDVKEENFGSTNTHLIKIDLPFDTSGKRNFKVYRYHGTELHTLTQTENEDGEYIEVDSKNNRIAIYAKKFSTYAIGYSETPPYSGSAILSPTDNPTDSDVEEPTDSDTDTPEDPDKPSNSDDSLNNSSGNGANSDSGQGTSAAQIGNNKKSPKTGEETDSFVWYLLMTAGLGVLFLAATKRRRTKDMD